MLKQLIISLFITVASMGQISHTFTLVDSAATTDSVKIPGGYYPVSLYTADLNKISELEFDFKYGSTWYTLSVPDSNYAISVADSVLEVLPKAFFENLRSPFNTDIFLRLDPNDSDTTTRMITITFDNK